jgi:starch phosphorylase
MTTLSREESPRIAVPPYCPSPTAPRGLDSLVSLALDLRWSASHRVKELWAELDGDLWQLTQNPWAVLQTVSRDRLIERLSDVTFRRKLDDVLTERRESESRPSWFGSKHPGAQLGCVAYFSLEFMLSQALPIYSGGLGNVAGDQLKAASDLGVPVVGVGLLYQRGYFRQLIDRNGAQEALFPYNDPGQLPVQPVRRANGEWLRLEVALPGYSVWLQAWQVLVGRVKLYLLDSNDIANFPIHRGITSELYGGGSELRLKQELVLGIGGWRLLEALGLQPDVCHLNEGHAAFVVLERAASFMRASGLSFAQALAVTRAGNLFTTHTSVAAGLDQFTSELLEPYLRPYAENRLGIPFTDLLALGRLSPEDTGEAFKMAYLAVRGSRSVNGVSRLHGAVSRQLLSPLFPRWPVNEVPVGHVTNGIHIPSWESPASDTLWTTACGGGRWTGMSTDLERNFRHVSDESLWELRSQSRVRLLEYTRRRLSLQLAASGAPARDVEEARHLLNPDILTVVFARRFAAYKRPNLLLHDPERLLRLLGNQDRPMQLILAGKAHPADLEGQSLIQCWTWFIRHTDARASVIFLGDYDMHLTEELVQGADVWLNTPRRPLEACGTSGMKTLVNGGINLSELDGWWAEAFVPELGWALGDGREHGGDPAWESAEAERLYDALEHEVVPAFYERDGRGIPTRWVAQMQESMASLTPHFSADRTVREYTERLYLPAAEAYQRRAADHGAEGRRLVAWQQDLTCHWAGLHFGALRVSSVSDQWVFEVELFLGEIDSESLQVELFANGPVGGESVRHTMECLSLQDAAGLPSVYRASISAARPASEYTVRALPRYPGACVPLESSQILWQH